MYIRVNNETSDIFGYGKKRYNDADGYTVYETSSWPQINSEPVLKKLCYWDGSSVSLKSDEMILSEHKKEKLKEIKEAINGVGVLFIDKTYTEIKTQIDSFRENIVNASSISEVNDLFNAAYSWLGLE